MGGGGTSRGSQWTHGHVNNGGYLYSMVFVVQRAQGSCVMDPCTGRKTGSLNVEGFQMCADSNAQGACTESRQEGWGSMYSVWWCVIHMK